MSDDPLSGVPELISLVRAMIADDDAEARGEAREAEPLWRAVYGTNHVSGRSIAEMTEDASRMLRCKTVAAANLALYLVRMLARSEGVAPVEVLDQVERDFAEILDTPSTDIDQP